MKTLHRTKLHRTKLCQCLLGLWSECTGEKSCEKVPSCDEISKEIHPRIDTITSWVLPKNSFLTNSVIMSSDAPPPGLSFHPRCGQLVTFSDHPAAASSSSGSAGPERRVVAHRSHASQEFNYGLVMSSQPLLDNQIFEVRALCQWGQGSVGEDTFDMCLR